MSWDFYLYFPKGFTRRGSITKFNRSEKTAETLISANRIFQQEKKHSSIRQLGLGYEQDLHFEYKFCATVALTLDYDTGPKNIA